MKLTVAILLLAAISHAAKTEGSRSKEKMEEVEKTDKRELEEGNAGIEKRTPLLPTAAPGIEYADSNDAQPDKSPTQQIYATPVPPVVKISDVLSGHGPAFQAAIDSHLYSPVSIYQPRVSSPTTYEIGAPVPSQLAYSEHRVTMPSQNYQQYNTNPQRILKQNQFIQEQPQFTIQKSYEQENTIPVQQILQQIPNNHFFQPLQYNPQHLPVQQQQQQQQQIYFQQQFNQPQPGLVYYQNQNEQRKPQPEQRDLKSQPAPSQLLVHQSNLPQENNPQQNAASYARFTYNPVSQAQQQLQQNHAQLSPQVQTQYQQHQVQTQPQAQLQLQPQPQPQIQYQLIHPLQAQQMLHHQIQPQPLQYQLEPQQQYLVQQFPQQFQVSQPQPQQLQLSQQQQPQILQVSQQPQQIIQEQLNQQQTQPQQFTNEPAPKNLERQPIRQQVQPSFVSEVYQQPQIQNGYREPLVPTFPPVQYFGKFAHSIFGGHQH